MPDKHIDFDGQAERSRPIRPTDERAAVPDREVPLPSATSDVINRWLDGEIPAPTGLRGDAARTMAFWQKVGEETDRRRQMATPAGLEAKIMAALPALTPNTPAAWYEKDVKLNPIVLVAGAAGTFVLGLLAARILI